MMKTVLLLSSQNKPRHREVQWFVQCHTVREGAEIHTLTFYLQGTSTLVPRISVSQSTLHNTFYPLIFLIVPEDIKVLFLFVH